MKQSVMIDGVSLTRAQIEQALADLNTPDIGPGDLVECSFRRELKGIVCSESLLDTLNRRFGALSADDTEIRCVTIDGRESWCDIRGKVRLIKKGPIA